MSLTWNILQSRNLMCIEINFWPKGPASDVFQEVVTRVSDLQIKFGDQKNNQKQKSFRPHFSMPTFC